MLRKDRTEKKCFRQRLKNLRYTPRGDAVLETTCLNKVKYSI